MTIRIVLEGIWGSNLDRLINRLIKDGKINNVEFSTPPSPFNGIRGWTQALTQSMATWRKEQTESTVYMRTVWSAYAYAKPFAGKDKLDQEEIALFQDMTNSLAELLVLPTVIVYCHSFSKEALDTLIEENSICSELTEKKLTELSNSLVEWLDDMKSLGVEVIEIPPPWADFESWYQYVLKQTNHHL